LSKSAPGNTLRHLSMPTTHSQSALIVSVGAQCHVGKERTENQDRISRTATPFGDLFVVADGMGGYQGGSQAAQATVDGFSAYLQSHGDLRLQDAVQQAARTISGELQRLASSNPALRGMGSTVALCVVDGERLTYAHAGDSRIYLWRDGRLAPLTRDHSLTQRLVSQGALTQLQARTHPDSSVLTRAIGQSTDVVLDFAEITLRPDDAVLICSDGLWAYVRQEEIGAIAGSRSLSASAVADALLSLALEGGGGDNVSIQFLRFESQPVVKSVRSVWGFSRKWALGVLALVSLIAAATLGLFLWNRDHPLVQNNTVPQTAPVFLSAPSRPRSSATTEAHLREVVIIEERDHSVAEWAGRLQRLANLAAKRRAGSAACLALEQETAALCYTHRMAEPARQIGKELGLTLADVVEKPAPDLRACGNEEMFALPPQPSLGQQLGKQAREGLQRMQKTVETLKKKVTEQKK
jgi:PPM family protein phosphatase